MGFNAVFDGPENMNATFRTDKPMIAEFAEESGSGSGRGIPSGGRQGDLLAKRTSIDGDVEWITPANSAEEDNTRPITAAAVYTEIGNINALLATI